MNTVTALPRGGQWLRTPIGPLQTGAPPETLKDTLPIKDGVPRIIVLPRTLFDVERGVAIADLEFPIYYNLFAKKRPLIVIGDEAQRTSVMATVQESLLGPASCTADDISADVAPGHHVPDLGREHLYFRHGEHYASGTLSLDDALRFIPLDAAGGSGGAVIEEGGHRVVICAHGDDVIVTIDNGDGVIMSRSATLPARTESAPSETFDGAFQPPRFGITVLGRSHGFDPDPSERTTGFILWIGGRGVLVDPPVHSTEILRDADIDQLLIDGIILTHVHGDHDAGVLQKALAAGKITLWTTTLIFQSWLRKWSALSAIPIAELEKLFELRPVQVGQPVDINGAKLLFRFTLHSIPTITFEAHFEGKSFNYSGDTLNEPFAIDDIHKSGAMDDARREELMHFDWSHDLIFHESGVPPLHTPLERLEALDDDIKARLRVLHTTPQRLVGRNGLHVARVGRAHTIELPVEQPPEQRVLRHLSLLGHTRLLQGLPLSRAADVLSHAKELHLRASEFLIKEGEQGDMIYVVTGGKARVVRDGAELKVYGLGDYIGETAVFLHRPRNASVVALTDLSVLAIDGDTVRRACEGTDIFATVERHDRVRALGAWTVLEETALFRGMTTKQKNHLESLLVPFEMAPGHRLVSGNIVSERIALIQDGAAIVTEGEHDDSQRATVVSRGVVGDAAALLAQTPQPGDAICSSKVTGFWLWYGDLVAFLDENPAIRVRIQPWTAHAAASTAQGMAQMVTEHLGFAER